MMNEPENITPDTSEGDTEEPCLICGGTGYMPLASIVELLYGKIPCPGCCGDEYDGYKDIVRQLKSLRFR